MVFGGCWREAARIDEDFFSLIHWEATCKASKWKQDLMHLK